MRTACFVLLTTLTACSANARKPATRDLANTATPAPSDAADATVPWNERFDFDGDGAPDVVDVAFSGGAHCCYTLAVRLTRTGRTVAIPFELDGGYVGGLSLALPDNFNIEVGPDRVAMMTMRIETYNGQPEPIPPEWQRAYGIHSNSIRVDLRDGTLRAADRP